MFARFAGIGVGHISQMLGRQGPALVVETTEESDEGEDLGMEVDVEHQAARDDHEECDEGDGDEVGDSDEDDGDDDDDDNDCDDVADNESGGEEGRYQGPTSLHIVSVKRAAHKVTQGPQHTQRGVAGNVWVRRFEHYYDVHLV
ncbi:hypothetical protein EV363DRAFT_1296465 [Boletus edulis]|nr:hypothetical protein EV363DRAFT_1296465 [Boletus edulis]